MKFAFFLLSATLSMAQASRLGLLRVVSHGSRTKSNFHSAEFGYTRVLQKEDGFSAFRELMGILESSMPMDESPQLDLSLSFTFELSLSLSLSYSKIPAPLTSSPTAAPIASAATPITSPFPSSIITATPVDVTIGVETTPKPMPTFAVATVPTPAPTPAPTSETTDSIDQDFSGANEAEEGGGSSGPDATQTILFIVIGVAAVAVGAALVARKYATARGDAASDIASEASFSSADIAGSPRGPAGDEGMMNVDL